MNGTPFSPSRKTTSRLGLAGLALAGLALAGLALAGLALGCADQAPTERQPLYNVILISIDTLRADHVGAYGYERPTTPAVDAFARDSVVFTQAIAQAPSTLHSHASMLSSLIPQHHRASWAARTRLAEEAVTLPEVLREHGYRTAAFTGGGQMAKIFGLDQGFESYVEPGKQHFAGTAQLGIEWMTEIGAQPFFLFLHSYEVHHPYEPDPKYLEMLDIQYDGELGSVISKDFLEQLRRGDVEINDEDLAYIIGTYDAEIRSMDDGFAHLVGFLKEKGLYDRTLIVFTSDHGEEFNEHGVVGWHSHSLYDELLKVPFIVKYPGDGYGGTVLGEQVRGIDLAPTVLGFLELPIPEEFSGADLNPLVRGEAMAGLDAVSRIDRKVNRERSSLRTPKWKLAGLAKRRALFDLENDPEELWDRALKDAEVTEELDARLEAILSSETPLEPPEVTPADTTLDELRALGYID